MKAWQSELELRLRQPMAPAVVDTGLLARFATATIGDRIPPRTLSHWLAGARRRGQLTRVVRGVYLNGFRTPAGTPSDAAPVLRRDAVVSLNTVLGDAGVLNNPSATVTAIVPLDPGPVKPVTGRTKSGVGWFHFFAMPRTILEAGTPEDRIDLSVADHVRATPERALMDWIYLGKSRRSRRTPPNPGDLDFEMLDGRRLKRLATAMGLEPELEALHAML